MDRTKFEKLTPMMYLNVNFTINDSANVETIKWCTFDITPDYFNQFEGNINWNTSLVTANDNSDFYSNLKNLC